MKKSEPKRLYRSRQDKIISGVCGGIAEYFNIDPIWVRLAAVLLIFADGIGLVLYILAWILVPKNPNQKDGVKTPAEKVITKIHRKHRRISSKAYKTSSKNIADDKHPSSDRGFSSRMFWGIVFIVIGTFFVLHNTGVLNLSSIFRPVIVIPLALILFGLALVLKVRWAFLVFILAIIIFGIFSIMGNKSIGKERMFTQEIPAQDGITNIEMDLDYGAGEIVISEGNSDYFFRNIVETSDPGDPDLDFARRGSKGYLSIERESGPIFWGRHKDKWDIELSPEVIYDLKFDFGATDMKINLEKLKIREMDMDFGAANTDIILGNYPSKIKIDTGASSLYFSFPREIGVAIEVDGGAVSTNLDGFIKRDDIYYSNNYDEAKDNIEIEIDAGASSIEGKFY